jgi:hypothetical protein
MITVFFVDAARNQAASADTRAHCLVFYPNHFSYLEGAESDAGDV